MRLPGSRTRFKDTAPVQRYEQQKNKRHIHGTAYTYAGRNHQKF